MRERVREVSPESRRRCAYLPDEFFGAVHYGLEARGSVECPCAAARASTVELGCAGVRQGRWEELLTIVRATYSSGVCGHWRAEARGRQ